MIHARSQSLLLLPFQSLVVLLLLLACWQLSVIRGFSLFPTTTTEKSIRRRNHFSSRIHNPILHSLRSLSSSSSAPTSSSSSSSLLFISCRKHDHDDSEDDRNTGTPTQQTAATATATATASWTTATPATPTPATTTTTAITVALTREAGKNEKLAQALHSLLRSPLLLSSSVIQIRTVEIPCIAHAEGHDYERLKRVLKESQSPLPPQSPPPDTAFDYVVVTSPEGAKILVRAIHEVANNHDLVRPLLHLPVIAAVGKATEHVLQEHGLTVAFRPSKATAHTLAAELPYDIPQEPQEPKPQKQKHKPHTRRMVRVLYPTSHQAHDTLERGLTQRTTRCCSDDPSSSSSSSSDDGSGAWGGFVVTRLNTYDTVPAVWTPAQAHQAQACDIVCFASPSSVQGWLRNTAAQHSSSSSSSSSQRQRLNTNPVAACIGETSAAACRKYGTWHESEIFYPHDQPGLEGWVSAVEEAVHSVVGVRREEEAKK